MPERTGKCINYTSCTIAYRNQPVTAPGDFVCPECGQPLQELPAKGGGLSKQTMLIAGGAVAAILLVTLIVFALTRGGSKSEPQTAQQTEPIPAATPEPEPPPLPPPTPAPVVTLPPPSTPEPIAMVPPTEPPVSPPPVDPTPPPPEPVPTEPPPPVTVEKMDSDFGSKDISEVRKAVIDRIKVMPRLTDRERSSLQDRVALAKKMGKLITIPFDPAKTSLSTGALEQLIVVTAAPEVGKLRRDLSVIFVVLGFADKRGDEKTNLQVSQARADSAMKALREKCGFSNVMHAVGMGGSDFFEKGDLAKNRVVEVWVVLP